MAQNYRWFRVLNQNNTTRSTLNESINSSEPAWDEIRAMRAESTAKEKRRERFRLMHSLFDSRGLRSGEDWTTEVYDIFENAEEVIVVNTTSEIPNIVDGQRVKYRLSVKDINIYSDPYWDYVYILEETPVLTEAAGISSIVTIYYDPKTKKLRAQADDGIHGLANVAFPNHLRTVEGQQYKAESLVWNGKNYKTVGEITPIEKVTSPALAAASESSEVDDLEMDTTVDDDDFIEADYLGLEELKKEAEPLLDEILAKTDNSDYDDGDGYESGDNEWTDRYLFYSNTLNNIEMVELLCKEYSKKLPGVSFYAIEDDMEEDPVSEIGYAIRY